MLWGNDVPALTWRFLQLTELGIRPSKNEMSQRRARVELERLIPRPGCPAQGDP